jgi:hypothetical protein
MKHKDSEKMVSGVILFGGLTLTSTHSNERRIAKEVEDEMELLHHPFGKGEGSKAKRRKT